MAARSNAHPYSSTVDKFAAFKTGISDLYQGVPVNCYMQANSDPTADKQVYFKMRPAITNFYQYWATETNSNPGNFRSSTGEYILTDQNIFWINPANPTNTQAIYTDSTTRGLINAAFGGTSNQKGGRVLQYQYTNTVNTTYYCIPDYVGNMFVVAAATKTGTTFTLPFNANPWGVVLDGYLFLAEYGGDTIYNSAVNDYTTWDTSVNMIRASLYPGVIRALGKLKSYVVVYKDSSIEFFYDAAYTDTSPLQRNASYTKRIGLAYSNSLAETGEESFFVGVDIYKTHKVYHLSEGSVKVISNPYIERILANDAWDYTTTYASGFVSTVDGKKMYFLNLRGDMFVYDIEQKEWVQWVYRESDTVSFPFPFTGVLDLSANLFQPIYFGSQSFPAARGDLVGYTLTYKSKDLMYDYTNSVTYNPNIYTKLVLPPTDFGTGNRKFMRELSISGFVNRAYPPATATQRPLSYSITMTKLTGGLRKVTSRSGTNENNPNYKNFGTFIHAGVELVIQDTNSDTTVAGLDYGPTCAGEWYGVNYTYSEGVS